MKQRILLVIGLCFNLLLVANSSPITTSPTLPIENQEVVITYDATAGTAGLKDFTGEIYAHIGVITDKSTGDSNWKYAPVWGDNAAKYKLNRVIGKTNEYTLILSPSIRSYFGVPASEKILKLAMVFRSADNSKEGKDTGGKDILTAVYNSELNVDITTPSSAFFIHPTGKALAISVSATFNNNIRLEDNGLEITSNTGQTLNYSYTPTVGNHTLVATAVDANFNEAHDTIRFLVDNLVSQTIPLPSGLRQGVNYIDDNTVTITLFAPYKQSIYLVGDFNNWQPDATYKMNKGDGADTAMYWITVPNLVTRQEYGYQFLIDNSIKIADPYTNKILDPYDDKYIPDIVYPNLKKYPEGKTTDRVSVLQTGQTPYQWEVTNFNAPDAKNLVIYELLIRDFQNSKIGQNNELGYLQQVIDSIDYIKKLGVNAIEVMPFNEFEGNNSWGYNPNFYFATDKAYGTANKYKEFIDLCHKNGIAVIMDLVLNHSFNSNTMARMYWDDVKGQPASNNPWFNTTSPHECYNWGSDFNHESKYTKAFIDSVNSYWMTEFKIDGFRFDFTKGFTNTKTTCSSGNGGSDYDVSRITILKRMFTEIRKRNPNAYVIFEHLTTNSEEKTLADTGIMLWGNMTSAYNEATMGYTSGNKSDVSWSSYKERGFTEPRLIPYMESHDEERQMYKNKTYGAQFEDYNTKDIEVSARRCAAAAAIYLAIPGPKMIWMFGERGYDVSIDSIDRVAPKPPKWEYMENPDRQYQYNAYSKLINLKLAEPIFSTTDFTQNVTGTVKQISLNMTGSNVRIVANFGMSDMPTTPKFSRTGYWYSHTKGDSVNVKDINMVINLAPGEFRIFSEKKMVGFEYNTSIGSTSKTKDVVKIYPLPFGSHVYLESQSIMSSIEIISITGEPVLKRSIEAESIKIDTSSLPEGMYVLKLTQIDGHQIVRQIIK